MRWQIRGVGWQCTPWRPRNGFRAQGEGPVDACVGTGIIGDRLQVWGGGRGGATEGRTAIIHVQN